MPALSFSSWSAILRGIQKSNHFPVVIRDMGSYSCIAEIVHSLELERLRLFRAVALVMGAFLLLAQAARVQSISPGSVVYAYEQALGQHDIDTAVAQFADDAVLTLQDSRTRTLNGPAQIREFLTGANVQTSPMPTSRPQVDGDTVIWTERTERPDQLLGGTDLTVQAVVHDGKIRWLEYQRGTLVRSGGPWNDAAPDAAPTAAAALAALVLLGVGLLSLATARSRIHSGSLLRGRLHRDLRRWRNS
jgi:hypothetical protein